MMTTRELLQAAAASSSTCASLQPPASTAARRSLAAALLCALLAACGGGGSDGSDSTTTSGTTTGTTTTVTAPTITTSPTSVSVTAGASASFSVVAATGGGTLSYQWYRNGTAISGATAASYTIATTATTDAGTYYVVVTNSAGSATSANATLTVQVAGSGGTGSVVPLDIAISSQPAMVRAAIGDAVSLSVTATGSGTLSYQWYKGGVAISGATAATYAIPSLAAGHAGRYHVVVTNPAGSLASAKATVTPTSSGEPVDVYDLNDGFNPADAIGNVSFAYTVTLNGADVTGTGFATSVTIGSVTTLTDTAGKTVVVDMAASPITVVSTVTADNVNVVLTDTFTTGIKFTSTRQFGIALDGATISSTAGPAINVNSAVRTFVVLRNSSTLTESSPAATASNAAFYSKGSLLFSGTGTATITAGADYATAAVKVKDHVRIASGTLTLKTRYNPATKLGGTAALIAGTDTSKTYGISASAAFVMDGGTVTMTSADLLSSGSFVGWGRGVGVSGIDDASSTNASVINSDGSVSAARTGFVIVNDGALTINTYDKALTAKYTCRGSTYTSSAGSYKDFDGDGVCSTPSTETSTAPADPNPFVTINGGQIIIRTTGTSCDPTETMGGGSSVCTSTSPKVSPEGIEAKSVLTVNGGTIEIESTDDAINAGISIGNTNYATNYGNAVVVNGGSVYAASSNNDGIDSNAVANPGVTINGGKVIANGTGAPEEGFDVDPYNVAFNGGTAIGIGGNNSSVSAASTQRYASLTSLSASRTLAIWRTSGSTALIFAYTTPAFGNSGAGRAATMTDAGLVSGGSYVYAYVDAASITCSAWFHGLCVGTMSAALPASGTTALTVR